MFGLPITNYHAVYIKKYIIAFLLLPVIVFVAGNIIVAIYIEKISVNPKSYIEKNGFPFFISSSEYIRLIKSYPYDFGASLNIHKMKRGQTYWDIATRNHISLDTIIAANPFLKSLLAEKGIEIVVPSEDGVLMAFESIYDVWRMSKLLNNEDSIKGDYLHSIFRLFSLDDMRFVFFKGSKPEIVNDHFEWLYKIRKIFQPPIKGYYTSLFGNRIDPFFHEIAFHNGIDIKARTGSPIYAAREGIATFSGWKDGFGLTVIVQHRDGYSTTYGHCSSLKVKKGDWVTTKDVVGLLGSTGRSTGPHLHFSIMRHGKAKNPLLYIW